MPVSHSIYKLKKKTCYLFLANCIPKCHSTSCNVIHFKKCKMKQSEKTNLQMTQWVKKTSKWACNMIKVLFQMHSCVFQVFEVTGSLSKRSVCLPTHEERMEGILLILSGSSACPRGLDPHPLPVENFRVCWRWTGCVWSLSNRAASHQVWVQKHYAINPIVSRSIIPCAMSALPWPVFSLVFYFWCNRNTEMGRDLFVNGDRMSEWKSKSGWVSMWLLARH